MKPGTIESRLRQASLLTGAGILVELLSLIPLHPLAFTGFLALGCPLAAAGILLFLFSLAARK